MTIKRYPRSVFLAFIFILQLVIAFSSPAQPLEGESWVIFPAEQAREQGIGAWFIQNGQSAEYWTPSEDNVLKPENRLSSYLRQANPDRFDKQEAPIWERLDEYNRQYIGIILDGKRIIYANYFCDSTDMDWRKDFVFVMDGGDCFFQFKYDTEFYDLQVNGNA